MFDSADILLRIREKPFRPFRIIDTEDQQFDVRNPALVLVGRHDVTIGQPGANPNVYKTLDRVTLAHIVAFEDLPTNPPTA